MSLKYSNFKDLKDQVQLDEYAKFYWAGHDMWKEFNTFIINEKGGSLKFYNGPSFSNSYTKPQFEGGSPRFTGVTFNTQQISFKVAVYAVTEEQYRRLIYTLHPYEINDLIFDFQKQWRYVVKLAKIADSTRVFLGYDSSDKEIFYTELTLTFEVQGDAVGHAVEEYGYDTVVPNANSSDGKYTYTIKDINNTTTKLAPSFLDTPFLFTFQFTPYVNLETVNPTIQLKYIKTDDPSDELNCFTVKLKNLIEKITYTFVYNSQTGDLLLKQGDGNYQILSLLTTGKQGYRIVDSLETNKVVLSGTANYTPNWNNIKLDLITNYTTIFCNTVPESDQEDHRDYTWITIDTNQGCGLNCFGRVNLI